MLEKGIFFSADLHPTYFVYVIKGGFVESLVQLFL
jgi:hypothetical protein